MILMPNNNSPHSSHASVGCIPSHKVSSIGFLAFVVSVINGVVSAANNINNNNNNNNNDNNQNNVNVNIGNLNSDQSSSSAITVPGVGRNLLPIEAHADAERIQRRERRQRREAGGAGGPNRVAVLHATAGAAISAVSLWFRALRTDDAAWLERMFCEAGQEHAAWEKRFGSDEVA